MNKILTLIALCITIALSAAGCMPNYSNGDRVGVVNKVSYKGMIFKDYDVQVNLGGLKSVSTDSSNAYVANVWNASTRDPDIAKQLEDAAYSGTPVRITYRQYLISPPTVSSDYIVLKVEPLQQ